MAREPQAPSAREVEGFFDKLDRFRNTLNPLDQQILDVIVRTACAEPPDTRGYRHIEARDDLPFEPPRIHWPRPRPRPPLTDTGS